jgi:hypothetical protein
MDMLCYCECRQIHDRQSTSFLVGDKGVSCEPVTAFFAATRCGGNAGKNSCAA